VAVVVKLAVQVNGKLRGEIEVERDLAQEEIKKLALVLPNVQNFVKTKPKKIIVVPDKIVNIVV
jgi:leucyl-tRNA synthetase